MTPTRETACLLRRLRIYTKIRDNGPVRFGLESDIKNSLIADGCVIEGKVRKTVYFAEALKLAKKLLLRIVYLCRIQL